MTHLTSTHEVDLDVLTWHRYSTLVLERGLEHIVSDSWATERMTLDGLHEHALSTLRDQHERAAVLDLGDDCLVHLSLRRGRASVYAAARTTEALRAAKEWLRERYPLLAPAEEQKANVTFWSSGPRYAGDATRR